jgi:hypothetical protein
MSKKQFENWCKELEADGWHLVDYQPYAKFAIYRKNGEQKVIGNRP